jgi:hypothetical protein
MTSMSPSQLALANWLPSSSSALRVLSAGTEISRTLFPTEILRLHRSNRVQSFDRDLSPLERGVNVLYCTHPTGERIHLNVVNFQEGPHTRRLSVPLDWSLTAHYTASYLHFQAAFQQPGRSKYPLSRVCSRGSRC